MKHSTLRIQSSEFDWLGYCTSCNVECCHNVDPSIPKNECTKPGIEKHYMSNTNTNSLTDKVETNSTINVSNDNTYDNRPIECQIFPFAIRDVDGKLEWMRHNICHATPALDYGKQIDFFERQFSKTLSLEHIKQYVEQEKLHNPEKYSSNNFTRIREVRWSG
jgi:hypothetical protein